MVVAGTLLILGGRAVREQLVRADVHFGAPLIVSRYAVGSAPYAFAYQQRRPAELSLQDGRCSVHRLVGTGTNFYDGPCRALRTPGGRTVFIGALDSSTEAGQAFAVLDGTLVRLEHTQVADRDVVAYFDSLRPVAPGDLDFRKG